MENYTKGEVKELEDPFPFSLDDGLQMRITQGSKIRNVMGFAMKKMADKDIRQIAWNGTGLAVTKAITCAEIMKRRLKELHQITKIRNKRIEEHWMPKVEGLEPLKVNRDIPAISILLSKDPLDTAEPGYQPPGNFEVFWQEKTTASSKNRRSYPNSSKKSGGRQDHRDQGHSKRSKQSNRFQNTASDNRRSLKGETSKSVDKREGSAVSVESTSKET